MQETAPRRTIAKLLQGKIVQSWVRTTWGVWRSMSRVSRDLEDAYVEAWEERRLKLSRWAAREWLTGADSKKMRRINEARAKGAQKRERKFDLLQRTAGLWRRRGQALLEKERTGMPTQHQKSEDASLDKRSFKVFETPPRGVTGSVAMTPDYLFPITSNRKRAAPRRLDEAAEPKYYKQAPSNVMKSSTHENHAIIDRSPFILETLAKIPVGSMEMELLEANKIKGQRVTLKERLSLLEQEIEYYCEGDMENTEMLSMAEAQKLTLEAQLGEVNIAWEMLLPKIEGHAKLLAEHKRTLFVK